MSAPSPHGGQTGSLLPGGSLASSLPCDLPGNDAVIEIVEGDAAFVAYPGRSGNAEAILTDANGSVVPVTLEPLTNSPALLARTETMLTAGEYTLSYDCDAGNGQPMARQARLVVAPAEPLPASAGELEAEFVPAATAQCSRTPWIPFTWHVDPVLANYADLLSVSIAVGEQDPVDLAHFGKLELDDETALVELPRCTTQEPPCLDQGEVDIVLSVTIAGEMQQPDPARLVYDGSCQVAGPAEETGLCAVHFAGSARPRAGWAWLLLMLAAARLRRRTRP